MFKHCNHTFVVSDIHLTTAEPVHPKDKLWKRYKQKDFFIDGAFEEFLQHVQKDLPGESIELIMAGDIFDFDGVTQLPLKQKFHINWLERKRGLSSEERKSRFKMRLIIEDHPVFFRALKTFVKNGNKLVFIIGNHDLELHWDSIKLQILGALELTQDERQRVRFNNWFYISNEDTLIEHGNQHDSHNVCQDPVNPIISGRFKKRIRLPFGSLANRYMMNGMGYFNPHSDRTYIMTLYEYMRFAVKHLLKREPLIMWTWFSGAIVTLVQTFSEGLTPEVKDPLRVEDQVEEIAVQANASPKVVRALKEIHAPPAIFDPIGVMRELWLDRAFLVAAAAVLVFELVSFVRLVVNVSFLWVFVLFALFIPFFVFYFKSIHSKVIVPLRFYERAAKLGARISGVKRVIYGHTHQFMHTNFSGIEYLNSGTWSPAFDDVECTKPTCPKTFVWIKPAPSDPANPENQGRVANVYQWKDHQVSLLC